VPEHCCPGTRVTAWTVNPLDVWPARCSYLAKEKRDQTSPNRGHSAYVSWLYRYASHRHLSS